MNVLLEPALDKPPRISVSRLTLVVCRQAALAMWGLSLVNQRHGKAG